MLIPPQTPKCPNCGNNENIQEVCKNCNYVYEESKDSLLGFWLWLFIGFHIAFLMIWVIDRTSVTLPCKDSFVVWYYKHIILTIWDALKNIF